MGRVHERGGGTTKSHTSLRLHNINSTRAHPRLEARAPLSRSARAHVTCYTATESTGSAPPLPPSAFRVALSSHRQRVVGGHRLDGAHGIIERGLAKGVPRRVEADAEGGAEEGDLPRDALGTHDLLEDVRDRWDCLGRLRRGRGGLESDGHGGHGGQQGKGLHVMRVVSKALCVTWLRPPLLASPGVLLFRLFCFMKLGLVAATG